MLTHRAHRRRPSGLTAARRTTAAQAWSSPSTRRSRGQTPSTRSSRARSSSTERDQIPPARRRRVRRALPCWARAAALVSQRLLSRCSSDCCCDCVCHDVIVLFVHVVSIRSHTDQNSTQSCRTLIILALHLPHVTAEKHFQALLNSEAASKAQRESMCFLRIQPGTHTSCRSSSRLWR